MINLFLAWNSPEEDYASVKKWNKNQEKQTSVVIKKNAKKYNHY